MTKYSTYTIGSIHNPDIIRLEPDTRDTTVVHTIACVCAHLNSTVIDRGKRYPVVCSPTSVGGGIATYLEAVSLKCLNEISGIGILVEVGRRISHHCATSPYGRVRGGPCSLNNY